MSLKNKRVAKGITIEKSNTERAVTLSIEHDNANANSMTVKVPDLAANVTIELPDEGIKLLSDSNEAVLTNKAIDASQNTITNLVVESTNIDSGTALLGRVLTADGAGNATWENTGSGANNTLSNLLGPTEVNQDLIPDTNNTRNLGSPSDTWATTYTEEVNTDSVGTISGTGSILVQNELDLNLNKITNLGTPTNAADAATKTYVDDVQAYVDTEISTLSGTVATNLSDGLATKVSLNGTLPFTADQSMGGFKLTNAADPTLAQDVATKNYVDLAIPSASTLTRVDVTTTWVVPAGKTSILIEGIGGGGGGGGGGLSSASQNTSGGGGGASGQAGLIARPVTAGETITVSLGSGGAGGAFATAGNAFQGFAGSPGGTTTVTAGTSGWVCRFPGGAGGAGGIGNNLTGTAAGGASGVTAGGLASSAGGSSTSGLFGTPNTGSVSAYVAGGAAGANGPSGTGGGGGGSGFAVGGSGGAGNLSTGGAGSLGSGGGGSGGSTGAGGGAGGAGGQGRVYIYFV